VAEGVGSPAAPAELTWALIMAAMRRLPQYIGNLKHGAWQQSGPESSVDAGQLRPGLVLAGRTLGVWGYGKIGQRVAGYGRAFGMQVHGLGPRGVPQRAQGRRLLVAASRDEAFFESCDVLSVHLRLNARDARRRDPGRPGAHEADGLFVNTSRAELVAENALVSALNRGRPGMAAVDVFEAEPILQGHPLLRLENAVCTPHIGYVEQDSYELYFGAAFDNVINFVNGQPDQHRQPGGAQGDPLSDAACRRARDRRVRSSLPSTSLHCRALAACCRWHSASWSSSGAGSAASSSSRCCPWARCCRGPTSSTWR
jgi:D-3-phosphoglycerate dehydrogenase